MRALAQAAKGAARALSHADTRTKDEALLAAADALGRHREGDPRREREGRRRRAQEGRAERRLPRSARARPEAARRDREVAPRGRGARRPGRRGDEQLAAPQRALGEEGPDPARRRPDGLRGAPQRDDRGRGPLREERQRGDPPPRLRRAPLLARARRGVRGRARRRRGCPAESAQVVPTPEREATFELLAARRPHRPRHPARRPRAHPRGGRAVARPGREALHGRLPPLPRRDRAARTTRSGSRSTARCSAPASATRSSASSSTAPPPRKLLPPVGKALADAGVELRCDPTSLTILAAGGRAGGPGAARGLRLRVPGQDPGRARRPGPRRRARPHRALRLAPHRGDPDARPRRAPGASSAR